MELCSPRHLGTRNGESIGEGSTRLIKLPWVSKTGYLKKEHMFREVLVVGSGILWHPGF